MEMNKLLKAAKKWGSALLAVTVILGVAYCAKNISDIKNILSGPVTVQRINFVSLLDEDIKKLNIENPKDTIIEQEQNFIEEDEKPKCENNIRFNKQNIKLVQNKPKKQNQAVKKSETVYVTKTGKCYHQNGCKYLRQSKIAVDKKKAQTKYRPCKDCYAE